jgi:hypothetical protein
MLKSYQTGKRFNIKSIESSKRPMAEKYDEEGKGFLTFDQLAQLYMAEAPGADALLPEDIPEALLFLGWDMDLWPDTVADWDPIYNHQNSVDWRGNFHVPGIGAGHVKTGRRTDYSTSVEFFLICVVLDSFGTDYLLEQLDDAEIVIGRSGFQSGPTRSDQPTFSPRWRVEYRHRFAWGRVIYPNQLQLAIPLSEMQAVSDNQGLSLYTWMDLGGQRYYINRDNVPFRNFDVPASALQSSGTP